MGEARRRGTFEERKAQAIAEGRIKRPTPKRSPDPDSMALAHFWRALFDSFARSKKRRK